MISRIKKKSFCLEHLGSNIMENNDILYALSETGRSGGMLIEKINNGIRTQKKRHLSLSHI